MKRGSGRIFRHRESGTWFIAYYANKKERRESVAKLLRKRPSDCTEEDAREALKLKVRALSYRGLGDPQALRLRQPKASYTPHDWAVIHTALMLGGPTPVVFEPPELRRMFGYVVYGYFRQGRALYIGRSAVGISRPCAANHHRLDAAIRPEGSVVIKDDDHLLLWTFGTEKDAATFEVHAIRSLRPQLNTKWRTADVQSNNGHSTEPGEISDISQEKSAAI